MANILLVKRRIQAAQNVSKTTRAMQMIAASKLKKGQNTYIATKPYAQKLVELSQNIVTRLDEDQLHEYMKKPKNVNKTLIVVFAPDKGLCGSLVTNLIREFLRQDNPSENIIYLTVGKKIEKVVANSKREIVASFKFATFPSFDLVYPIAKIIDEYFLQKKVSGVKIISTNFSSVFSQSPKVTQLLPIDLPQENIKPVNSITLFEPDASEILPSLLLHYLEMSLYQLLVESYAAEQAARMVAMQNATDNAADMIKDLKLEYNKKRQEKITNEILDIGSSAFTSAYE